MSIPTYRAFEVVVARTEYITVPVLALDENDASERALATGLGSHFARSYGGDEVEDVREVPVCNPNE